MGCDALLKLRCWFFGDYSYSKKKVLDALAIDPVLATR